MKHSHNKMIIDHHKKKSVALSIIKSDYQLVGQGMRQRIVNIILENTIQMDSKECHVTNM